MQLKMAERNTSLDADESARVLTDKIFRQEPFFFVRYGDGALECINGHSGCTVDREFYSKELGIELFAAWQHLMHGQHIYVGDWLSASFDAGSRYARYETQYAQLIGKASPAWLHFEALLLMRESDALVDFYRAIKADERRKLYMGPEGNAGAARMLGATHLITPMQGLFEECESLFLKLADFYEFDVLLYGAGMAGHIPVVKCWQRFPERTYINLGSALDPLFRGRSRRQQITPERARILFKDLL
ncbi:MAG TPA: hypothetical protein VNH18_14715 [Bryobacteraceae bacterium]|nr:hypothetical protein [Blastocatellia bacterium]HXJ40531.1 hypothetical protein [Bryobacteraceae bacterium]